MANPRVMQDELPEDVIDAPEVSSNVGGTIRASIACVIIAFGAFGGWSAYARLDSAAVSTGVLVSSSNIQTIQHLEGGIVEEILVRNGDRVEAGQTLLRLDATRSEATSDLFERQRLAALAATARLEAQRRLSDTIVFPTEIRDRMEEPTIVRILLDQEEQFANGRSALQNEIDVLRTQNEQIKQEIEGLTVEAQIAEDELALVSARLADLEGLLERQLIERSTVADLQRDELRLQGTVARSKTDIVRANQRIAENEVRIAQAEQVYRREAANQLPELAKEIRELERQIIVSRDAFSRDDVVAPISGTVQELQVFTTGGVVQGGETILNIAPEDEDYLIQAQISPLDIDSIQPTMEAEIRFPAFQNLNLLPMRGTVTSTSRDRIEDPGSRSVYFAVEVAIDEDTIPKTVRERMIAGLSADIIIPTGERTALDYLISPLAQRMSKAMREE